MRPWLRPILLLAALTAAAPAPPPAPAAPPRNIAGPGDYQVRERVIRVLTRDPELQNEPGYHVVLVNGGVVLSGEMSSCAIKTRALRLAASTRGVINVTDEVRVRAAMVEDDDLRRAVRGVLEDRAAELGLQELSVEVDGGVARLGGRVTGLAQRIAAEEAAGRVAGITRVANHLLPADAPGGTDDPSLARAVQGYLRDFRLFPHVAEIEVAVRDGVVTLTGRTNLCIGRQLAGNMTSLVGGVARVDNRIRVDPSLATRRTIINVVP
ncbi:MAG: BON domain-containing protein [Candidatus Polarisedimenticolia bacterium]